METEVETEKRHKYKLTRGSGWFAFFLSKQKRDSLLPQKTTTAAEAASRVFFF
jgi:hypothetical protein